MPKPKLGGGRLLHIFKQAGIRKIDFFNPAKIKEVNDDRNGKCQEAKKEGGVYKTHQIQK